MSRKTLSGKDKRVVVSLIGGFILGSVLVIATVGKVAKPIVLVEQIRNEQLDLFLSANAVALITLFLEMGLGVALLLGDRSRWVLTPSLILVGCFLALTGRMYWLVVTGQMENTYDCGCFGVFLERTAKEAFWQDLFLLLPPLLMCFVGWTHGPSRWPSWRFWAGVVGAILIVLYAQFGVGMPEVPGGEAFSVREGPVTFAPAGDYTLLVEGEEDPNVEVFYSDSTLQFVVVSSQISSPLVLDLRKNQVFGITPGMVSRKSGNTLEAEFSSGAEELTSFEVGSQGLSFVLSGQTIQFRSRE